MGATAAATLAALAGREPVFAHPSTSSGPEPVEGRGTQTAAKGATADAVIVLWMAGGMAQTETFDPKRYTPFAPGVRVDQVLSTFPAIPTAVDHINFTQGLEQIGSVIDRGAVIRTFNAADLGFILHSRHQYHWHTGYIPPQPMAMPHLGAVISKTLGPKNPDMPAFVAIGQTIEGPAEIGTLKAFHTAGFLGTEHGPFDRRSGRRPAVRPPKGSGDTRFHSRRELFSKPSRRSRSTSTAATSARVAAQVPQQGGPAAAVSVGKNVSALRRAEGDLRYLQQRPFRPGLLLARRLTKRSARCESFQHILRAGQP
jgi:hypothetical protein